MIAAIRKIVVQVDEIHVEMGRSVDPPARRAVAMAVIANPFAGRYAENLDELITIGEELGGLLGDKAVAALGIAPDQAQSYGKAAIVGEGTCGGHFASKARRGSAARGGQRRGTGAVGEETRRPRHGY